MTALLDPPRVCGYGYSLRQHSIPQLLTALLLIQNFDDVPASVERFSGLLFRSHILRLSSARWYDTEALALKQHASKYGLN